MRRAERGLALAVRDKQARGEIRAKGAPPDDDHVNDTSENIYKSPGTYVGDGQARSDAYAMTDGVPDEVFEEALAEAKAGW